MARLQAREGGPGGGRLHDVLPSALCVRGIGYGQNFICRTWFVTRGCRGRAGARRPGRAAAADAGSGDTATRRRKTRWGVRLAATAPTTWPRTVGQRGPAGACTAEGATHGSGLVPVRAAPGSDPARHHARGGGGARRGARGGGLR